MYVRPQNYKYPAGMRLPENYAGNAFREANESIEAKAEEVSEVKDAPPDESKETAALLPRKEGFGLRLSSIFGDRGFGNEELLILGLILLLADGEGCDDLILFLALLFFIK